MINESKLKKAKMFFDDSPELAEQEYYSVPFQTKKGKAKIEEAFEECLFEENTMPCFKTVGTGLEVKVSKEMQSKAKLLLSEFSSLKKSTKLKKAPKCVD
jgi:hypothetical protein